MTPQRTGTRPTRLALPHPSLVPAPPTPVTLTDAPQPMEPAGRVREMTVEVRIRGTQEIKKHEELLGREARWDVANLALPSPSLTGTQWVPWSYDSLDPGGAWAVGCRLHELGQVPGAIEGVLGPPLLQCLFTV